MIKDTKDGTECEYAKWRDRWVYIAAEERYVDLHTRQRLKAAGWGAHNAALKGWPESLGPQPEKIDGAAVPWTKLWKGDPEAQRCVSSTMCPGQPQMIPTGDDVLFNEWLPPPALELAKRGISDGAAVKNLQRLINHLCRFRMDMYMHVIAWIAHGIFRPTQRPMYAVMLISETRGLGKSLLIQMLAKLYGEDMCTQLDKLEQLTGRFGGAWAGKMLVGVHEVYDGKTGRFSAMDAIKGLLTDPRNSLERKGVDPVMVENHARFIFATNRRDGLPIDAAERRVFAVDSGDISPLDDAFYAEFAEQIRHDDGLADISAWLQVMSAQLAPLPARAPHGDRDNILDATAPDWVLELKAFAAQLGRPVVWRASQVQIFAKGCADGRVSQKAVGKAMEANGFRKKRTAQGVYYTNAPDPDFNVASVQPDQIPLL